MERTTLIDAFLSSAYRGHIKTLKECSRDTANSVAMVTSQVRAICFDDVKSQYIVSLDPRSRQKIKSFDALLLEKSGDIDFIEFKNGCIDSHDAYEIMQKIFDSLLIFLDVTERTLKDARRQVTFILVYNEKKNKDLQKWEFDRQDFLIQQAPSRVELGKILANKADTHFIRFGLERFKGYCFKEVRTLTVTEFDTILNSKIFPIDM